MLSYRGDHGENTGQKVKVALRVVSLVRALQKDISELTDGRGGGCQTLDGLSLEADQLVECALVLAHVGQEHASQIRKNVLLGDDDRKDQVLQKVLVVQLCTDKRVS